MDFTVRVPTLLVSKSRGHISLPYCSVGGDHPVTGALSAAVQLFVQDFTVTAGSGNG
jgi:hypothetical protein